MTRTTGTVLVLAVAGTLAACNRDSADPSAGAGAAPGARVGVPAANLVEVTYEIEGMHCDGCVETISTEVAKLDHVHGLEVSLEQETAVVRLDDAEAADAVAKAIEALGFGAKRR